MERQQLFATSKTRSISIKAKTNIFRKNRNSQLKHWKDCSSPFRNSLFNHVQCMQAFCECKKYRKTFAKTKIFTKFCELSFQRQLNMSVPYTSLYLRPSFLPIQGTTICYEEAIAKLNHSKFKKKYRWNET
jgi:hypothetical protein